MNETISNAHRVCILFLCLSGLRLRHRKTDQAEVFWRENEKYLKRRMWRNAFFLTTSKTQPSASARLTVCCIDTPLRTGCMIHKLPTCILLPRKLLKVLSVLCLLSLLDSLSTQSDGRLISAAFALSPRHFGTRLVYRHCHFQRPSTVWMSSSFSPPDEVVQVVQSNSSVKNHHLPDVDLWRNWVQHTDISHHHFDKQQAKEIRAALLEWYRENRRKLPWRGDVLAECSGSTAGINNSDKKASKKKKMNDKKQPSIKHFFGGKSKPVPKREKPEETPSSDALIEQQDQKAIPVSGYGVWVSEIMLQQTRVEAVIPYWIKCK